MPAATDDASATATGVTDTSAKKDIEVRDVCLLLSTQPSAALEATQGQMDDLCSQLPYKCDLEEVASAED